MFEPKREEVAAGWRRLHDEELHNFHASPNAIRAIKPEGKKPLGRSKRRWEGNIIDLREIMWEVVDRMHLTDDRDQWWAVVNRVMNLPVS